MGWCIATWKINDRNAVWDEDMTRDQQICAVWSVSRYSVALLVACWTNNRKVVGSRPTKVVCITVLTGNCLGWTVCRGRPTLLPSCRKLEFRLSALMDSDLAWVNGKSGRHSWRYADAFHRCIISGAIYHFFLCITIDWPCNSQVKANTLYIV